jgi:cellobiose-specific phosphotransferase system component IIB
LSIGSTHLKRHIKTCIAKESQKQTSIHEYFESKAHKKVTQIDKKEVKKLTAVLCCKDLKPFNTFESDSFINLSQKLVNLGANCGRFDVKLVLPSHKYVSNEVNDVYDNLVIKLKNEIKDITFFGITTDHWTHTNSSKNYLTLTLQYIKS